MSRASHRSHVAVALGVALSAGCDTASSDVREWEAYSVGELVTQFSFQPDQVESALRFIDNDGDLYVADNMARRVSRLDPTGRVRWSFGRKGNGPGEFEQISWLAAAPGGDLWVGDGAARRITIVTQDGGLRASLDMNSPIMSAAVLSGDRVVAPGLTEEAAFDTLAPPFPARSLVADGADPRALLGRLIGRTVVGAEPTWLVDMGSGRVWTSAGGHAPVFEIPDWMAKKVEQRREKVRRAFRSSMGVPVYRTAHATASGDLWLLLNGVEGYAGIIIPADSELPIRSVSAGVEVLRDVRDALVSGDTLIILQETGVQRYRFARARD